MLDTVRNSVRQRSDLTYKHNTSLGRHGWLRLTPAYSVKLVKEIIAEVPRSALILDPFSGTATTPLTAAEHGNDAVAFDINPFLIWLGQTKCRTYTTRQVNSVRASVDAALVRVPAFLKRKTNWQPPIFNIDRWWSPSTLAVLAAVREALVDEIGEPARKKSSDLAWVAFCRLIIETSSAAFNHVSMSFSTKATNYELEHVTESYSSILEMILQSCEIPLLGSSQILYVDARVIPNMDYKFDLVITSPPYPNRISYIRELRPYMYWLKFLDEAREAGEMDWKAIGGTWGIATSRLTTWEQNSEKLPKSLLKAVNNISSTDTKNANLLATYVLKYFYDMHLHLKNLPNVLKDGAELHYIVGNSTFFGHMVDTPGILKESIENAGL